MSIFRVNLNNRQQGTMDRFYTAPDTGGTQFTTSRQRTAYIMGPGKVNRKMVDGQTFQDCNYYKRFCYPQVSLEDAILTVVSDDNSIWSDDPSENTYPKAYSQLVVAGSAYAANTIDILGDTGGYATFVQLTNTDAATDLQVRLNGVTDAVFTLEHASVQVFNAGDLQISMIEIANNLSGGVNTIVEILCAVRSVCNS